MKFLAPIAAVAAFSAAAAQAAIISVTGPLSDAGGASAIIAAPIDVGDDAAINNAQQGFNELQDVLLGSDLTVQGGVISSGTRVDSHMIFLNSQGTTAIGHYGVTWTFDGAILGVMVDRNGTQEAASNSILGAPGTLYPGSFSARGLESQ